MPLEDEHARLRAVPEVGPLEDLGVGQLVRLDGRGDVDDVDPGALHDLLAGRAVVLDRRVVLVMAHRVPSF